MFKALYHFKNDAQGYLSFEEGDLFTVITADQEWFLALDAFGGVGYVPANYVTKKKGSNTEILKFIDQGIEAIHYVATSNSGVYTQQQREALQKLLEHRKNIISDVEKRVQQSQILNQQPKRQAPGLPAVSQALSTNTTSFNPATGSTKRSSRRAAPPPPPNEEGPPPPVRTVNTTNPTVAVTKTTVETSTSRPKSQAPSLPVRTTDTSTSPIKIMHDAASLDDYHEDLTYIPSPPRAVDRPDVVNHSDVSLHVEIPDSLAADLIELVRRKTSLNYSVTRSALTSVMDHIKQKVPTIGDIMDSILEQLVETDKRSSKIENSRDAERLNVIFAEMAYCKDDSQQRSWSLHEDESVITEYLEELLSILDNADPGVIRHVLAADNFEPLQNLVIFYQMETRLSIRLLLLKCFGALCGLSYEVLYVLLNTVLPLELARDIQNDLSSLEKVKYSALVLTMLFSQGQTPPIHYYDHINADYVQYILETIDNPPELDDAVSDTLTHFLLSYNLHFKEVSTNIVMKALASHATAKTFTEKVMLLFNRGDDPVDMFDYEPKAGNSLQKVLSDIYSSQQTASIIYTNDTMVLIDIVLRHITDRSPGDKMRTEYLSLMHQVIQHSDYEEHLHRRAELQSCFRRIQQEDSSTDSSSQLQMDKYIVQQIFTDFQRYFPDDT